MTTKKTSTLRKELSKEELRHLRTHDVQTLLKLKLSDAEKTLLDEINIEREQIRLEKSAQLGAAEELLVQALNAIGLDITSAWDLVNTRERYDAALPILAEHLERDYPPEIQEGIARAMAVRDAIPWRGDFIRLYRQLPPLSMGVRDGFREGLAVAIGNTTTSDNVWETIALLRDASLGTNRVLMLAPFGRMRDPEVRQAILELRETNPEIAPGIGQLGWVKKLDREARSAVGR